MLKPETQSLTADATRVLRPQSRDVSPLAGWCMMYQSRDVSYEMKPFGKNFPNNDSVDWTIDWTVDSVDWTLRGIMKPSEE